MGCSSSKEGVDPNFNPNVAPPGWVQMQTQTQTQTQMQSQTMSIPMDLAPARVGTNSRTATATATSKPPKPTTARIAHVADNNLSPKPQQRPQATAAATPQISQTKLSHPPTPKCASMTTSQRLTVSHSRLAPPTGGSVTWYLVTHFSITL